MYLTRRPLLALRVTLACDLSRSERHAGLAVLGEAGDDSEAGEAGEGLVGAGLAEFAGEFLGVGAADTKHGARMAAKAA